MTADKRRIAWGYEPHTPRCCNCVGYRKAGFEAGKLTPPMCTKGKFQVSADGCCDKWSSKQGERLQP